jgi:hypothetical protein
VYISPGQELEQWVSVLQVFVDFVPECREKTISLHRAAGSVGSWGGFRHWFTIVRYCRCALCMLLYRARIEYIAVLNAAVGKPLVTYQLMHPGAICIYYKGIESGACVHCKPKKTITCCNSKSPIPKHLNTGSSSKLVLVLL